MSAADLIARARDRAETLRSVFPDDGEVRDDARLMDRLADALEAAEAARDAAADVLRERDRQVAERAWDEGAEEAWNRSTPLVNGLHYKWRTAGEPLNPYRIKEESND